MKGALDRFTGNPMGLPHLGRNGVDCPGDVVCLYANIAEQAAFLLTSPEPKGKI